MSKIRPHFLITNDDGIHSQGIYQLWLSLKDHADMTIVAPDKEKSGSGLGLTIKQPLRVTPIKWYDEATQAYTVSGTPADCVRVAIKTITHRPYQMVLSGINKGLNSGRTVLYSGTIGGVIQGVYFNIPGIAFSHFKEDEEGLDYIRQYIWPIVDYFSGIQIPKGTFLNVNFPGEIQQDIKGFKMATQGFSTYDDHLMREDHPDGYHLLHPTTFWKNTEEPITSDVYWLNQGFATISPLKVEELTDRDVFEQHKDHAENHFSKFFYPPTHDAF